MAPSRTALTAAVITAAMVAAHCARAPGRQAPQLLDLAPAAVAITGWQLAEAPRVYVGDELFELVNGGAELYHRLGFTQVLSAQYAGAGGRSIALELFEMRDPEAARAIYSEKTGNNVEQLDIGDEAALESYYLNFRAGRFLVTITGFDSDPETVDGLIELARAIEQWIGGEA